MLRKNRVRAEGSLKFIEPRFIRWVYTLMRLSVPTYLRFAEGIGRVETEGIEHLIASYRQFYDKKARLFVAFRHASVHDAPVMVYLFCRALPAAARKRGEKLGGLGHAHFLYGRGVLHWAGGGASFLIPRIAGIPVMNRRSDTQGMRAIRRALTDGRFPISLAPEGQVTYHNHKLGPIEAGTARLAIWCLQDLERQGRQEEILVVPVASRYLYTEKPEEVFRNVVERIANRAGLQASPSVSRYEQLIDLTDQLLTKIETFYERFYGLEAKKGEKLTLRGRIEGICDSALMVPESFMKIRPDRDFLSRVFTVRQRGWDYLFRSDFPEHGEIPPLDRVLADRVADEAYLHLRHNELVDLLEYIDPDYISPQASLNRLLEYALNLADVINRLMGGDISFRYSPMKKKTVIRIAEPLKVRELYPLVPGNTREKAEGIMKVITSRLENLAREE